MEQARRKKIIDVFGTVLKLREDRDRMVQNEVNCKLIRPKWNVSHFLPCRIYRNNITSFTNASRATAVMSYN